MSNQLAARAFKPRRKQADNPCVRLLPAHAYHNYYPAGARSAAEHGGWLRWEV